MKINIKNFQRHKDSSIELVPGVTAIIGKSDHGKSSIVRAIGWFCFDKPKGNAFVRRGTSTVAVSIDNVAHIKEKNKNYYTIDGSLVETDKAMSLSKINPVNIQRQHEPPFLLDVSAGEVARNLALLIDLSKPQEILKNLKKKGTALSSRRDMLLGVKEKYEKEVAKYIGLVKHKRALASIESRTAQVEKTAMAQATLAATIENATAALSRLDTIPKTEQLLAQVRQLQHTVDTLSDKDKNTRHLLSAIDTAKDKESKRLPDYSALVSTGNALLARENALYYKIGTIQSMGDTLLRLRRLNVCLIKHKKGADLIPLVRKKMEEFEVCYKIMDMCNTVGTLRVQLELLISRCKEKEEFLARVKQDIGVCPLCGGSLHD